MAISLCCVGTGVFAFKQSYHEQLTEQILRSLGFDEDSADEVGDSNYYTDIAEPSSDAAHADNNHLAAASLRLQEKRTAIGDALNNCKRRAALDALGEALHTVQDIYSHSNAIDNGHAIPDILNMSDGSAACSLPDFAPAGLVTGYFNLNTVLFNQCSGMRPNMCCHRDLNKDAPSEANGARHSAALAAAGDATRQYLQLVEQDLQARFGEPKASRLMNLFKRKQRTLYFVIDDTGSMGTDIAGVKSAVNGYIDQVLANGELPTLGLASFKDSVNDRGPGCDPELVRSQVNGLFASGGNDCPEASNAGLLAALRHFPTGGTDMQAWGGRILLATDASAGDAHLGPQVVMEANQRGVVIDAILTGDCTSEELTGSGLAPGSQEAELLRQSRNAPQEDTGEGATTDTRQPLAGDPLTSPSARTQLRAIAEQTGGVLFNTARVEVDDVVPTLLELGRPDNAILFSRKVQLQAGMPYSAEFPVDDSLGDKVTFMVTASRSGVLPAFSLHRPDGSPVRSSDPDASIRTLSSVVGYTMNRPPAGRWKVHLQGAGTFILRAFGATPFRINGLRLQVPAEGERRPHVDLIPIEGQPLVGAQLIADLRFTYPPTLRTLSLRRLDGSLVQELSATPTESSRSFRAEMRVPGELFVLEATGLTPGGKDFIRQATIPITPQLVAVLASPRVAVGAAGSTAAIDVELRHRGAAATTYRLRTGSALGWTVSSPTSVSVEAGASARFRVNVSVPAEAPVGLHNEVSFFVEDVGAPQVRNSASVVVVSGPPNRPPVCTGARPSLNSLWPANHAMRTLQVLGVTDPDGDVVALTFSGITQDEPVDGPGSGQTAPDAEGVGQSEARLRAERAGGGDGRVYALSFTASDGKGGQCSGSVRVGVPHRAGQDAVDSGQRYDSTTRP
ncbi:MAG TPA: hypothetical protein VEY88_19130 [Archangium sp.]|nr:hypothetical protein [Archangium sp.]